MRLDEIRPSAADQRVNRLKANAKTTKDRAQQMKAQADMDAKRLEQQKSREAMAKLQRSAVTSNIKPHR